jgi:hypothetical protein
MSLGYDVIFADADIVIIRDPIPILLWKNVDYVHSVNAICTRSLQYHIACTSLGATPLSITPIILQYSNVHVIRNIGKSIGISKKVAKRATRGSILFAVILEH